MNDDDEIIDVVDETDTVVGIATHSQLYSNDIKWFRVINGFLVNSRGQLLISKRSPTVSLFPLALDASVGGHVRSGESYEDAFGRELREELLIDISKYEFRLLGSLNPIRDQVSAFMHVFEVPFETIPSFNISEILDCFWIFPDELVDSVRAGAFAKDDLIKIVTCFFL